MDPLSTIATVVQIAETAGKNMVLAEITKYVRRSLGANTDAVDQAFEQEMDDLLVELANKVRRLEKELERLNMKLEDPTPTRIKLLVQEFLTGAATSMSDAKRNALQNAIARQRDPRETKTRHVWLKLLQELSDAELDALKFLEDGPKVYSARTSAMYADDLQKVLQRGDGMPSIPAMPAPTDEVIALVFTLNELAQSRSQLVQLHESPLFKGNYQYSLKAPALAFMRFIRDPPDVEEATALPSGE